LHVSNSHLFTKHTKATEFKQCGKNVVIIFYDSLNCLLIHITLRNVQEGE